MGKILATITGNLYLILGSFVLSLLAIPLGRLSPRGILGFWIMRIWSWSLLRASWLRLRVHYAPELDPGASYVFLSNHQSLFDIPLLLATVPGPVRLVAKKSLFRIPLFGWALAASGFIAVDRADRTAARQSFASAEKRLREGGSLLLFPEGTRALDNRLLPFKRGGVLLAMRGGLPIVPVGIRGTRAIQPRGSRTIRPGTVEVRYGAPIEVAHYGIRRKSELIAELRRQVAELSGTELADTPESPEAE